MRRSKTVRDPRGYDCRTRVRTSFSFQLGFFFVTTIEFRKQAQEITFRIFEDHKTIPNFQNTMIIAQRRLR